MDAIWPHLTYEEQKNFVLQETIKHKTIGAIEIKNFILRSLPDNLIPIGTNTLFMDCFKAEMEIKIKGLTSGGILMGMQEDPMEQIRRQAFDDGYKEGYSEGLSDGVLQGKIED